ncbi:DUF6350 family protein [Streptomyces sp. NPDC044571]|uniref:cell division protein PerM n=1 Tax=Streptomyces sp. NPDC044571 TaxID=3155371 RepID=UPI0033F29293
MTQVTERGTPLPPAPQPPAPLPTAPRPAARRRRSPAAAACVLGGAVAAGLGLGFLAVLVIVLWISSPYPDSGPGGALHLAAGLWLLAHGTELVRYETLSGTPSPVGLTPLLLVALPALLMRRAARLGSAADDGDEVLPASAIFSAVTCGYLGVGSLATVYAAGGPMPADPLSAAWHVPLVAVLAAGAGVWSAKGRPLGPLPRWVPGALRQAVARPRYALALRAGTAGALVLLGGGVLLVGASLVWHGAEARTSLMALTGVWSGRFAVLLLALALLPNAAVWGAAYALGPGFALGTGVTATPLGLAHPPQLPRFPLLAALPPEGPGTLLTCATAGLPVLAGLVVGWFAVRRAREVPCGETALTTTLGAVVCGLLMAGLAAASAGPLGSRQLASFGPVWWATGVAAFAWTLLPAVPVAVAVHSWRNRPARRGAAVEDDWHDSGVREVRWEALRRTAVALVPELPGETTPAPVPAPAADLDPPAPAKAPRKVKVVTGIQLDLASLKAPPNPPAPNPPAPNPTGPSPAAPLAAAPEPATPQPADPVHQADPPAQPQAVGAPLVPPVAGARVLARRRPPA